MRPYCGCGGRSRLLTHIGVPFSGIVLAAELAFCRAADSPYFAFEIAVTPPPAVAARLDSVPLSLPARTSATRKAPARTDRPFKGIALILLSTVFLGTSDVTAKYLSSSLPSIEIAWIRFLVFALIMTPAMLPGTPLFALRSSRPGCPGRRQRHGGVDGDAGAGLASAEDRGQRPLRQRADLAT